MEMKRPHLLKKYFTLKGIGWRRARMPKKRRPNRRVASENREARAICRLYRYTIRVKRHPGGVRSNEAAGINNDNMPRLPPALRLRAFSTCSGVPASAPCPCAGRSVNGMSAARARCPASSSQTHRLSRRRAEAKPAHAGRAAGCREGG